jgi:hypothetical protein
LMGGPPVLLHLNVFSPELARAYQSVLHSSLVWQDPLRLELVL